MHSLSWPRKSLEKLRDERKKKESLRRRPTHDMNETCFCFQNLS